MTSDERGWSLADQAAAWVPPWARTKPARQDSPASAQAEPSPAQVEPSPAQVEASPAQVEALLAQAEETSPRAEEPSGVEHPPTGSDEPQPGAEQAQPGPDKPQPGFDEPQPGADEPQPAEAAPTPPSSDEAALPAPLALAADNELRGALEAILLVVDEPVSEVTLAQVLEQPTERIGKLLSVLAEEYALTGRGFELRQAGGGWRLYTRPAYADYVERFVLDGQQLRLTQAALETLAVVAYKQPVTRSRVSAIRGVNCDGVIRTLISRGLVEECGAEPDSGAYLYRTTTLFLEKLGLNSVHDLPPLAPFLPDNVDEISDAPH